LIRNHGNNDSPLKLPSVHHNPPCGGCAHDHYDDAEVRKHSAKRGLVNKTQPRKHWVSSRHFDQLKKK